MNLLPTHRRWAVPLFAGLVLTALATGCGREEKPAEEEKQVAVVKIAETQALFLGEWTELLGTTQPLPGQAARITAAIEGRVLSLSTGEKGQTLTEGQEVHAGDVIVQLDDRVARANRANAAAALLDFVEQRKQADIAVRQAQLTLTTREDLWKKKPDLVPELDLKVARLALDDAQSKQRGMDAKETAAKANLKVFETQLDLFTLRSPIDGRLGMIQVVPGQTLAVGTTVADVINLKEIDALCFVPPRTMAVLNQGDPNKAVRLMKDSEPSTEGKIVFLGEQAQAETGNYAVKVRFPNKDGALKANAVVRVQVLTQPRKRRVTIPEAALMEDQDPPAVVVVEKLETTIKKEPGKPDKEERTGKARILKAKIGVRSQGKVEILGLEDPESKAKVPLQGVHFVTEGGHGLQTDDNIKLAAPDED
jgi:RND family efflux transporter MFP subunit